VGDGAADSAGQGEPRVEANAAELGLGGSSGLLDDSVDLGRPGGRNGSHCEREKGGREREENERGGRDEWSVPLRMKPRRSLARRWEADNCDLVDNNFFGFVVLRFCSTCPKKITAVGKDRLTTQNKQ
jgi:hypothetical protein